MKHAEDKPLVRTIKERCRVCYTCVRECPAKAIRIADGQAEVIEPRCIGCGNCVKVCSQGAKDVLSGIEETTALLDSPARVTAVLAPSFPAEFSNIEADTLVGMLRKLGFDNVVEVAFGADLVARKYAELLEQNPDRRYIATSCPSVVAYVERFHPALVDRLAPIVSPMIAIARVLHRMHGPESRVVFVGPCIAKKGEAASRKVEGDIDAVLTFGELRQLFNLRRIRPEEATPSSFDPPHPGKGALFPVSRGMLQAAGLAEDLMEGDIVATDGHNNFRAAIQEFESGAMDARLLEVLCCNGCIMGAGMTVDTPKFRRRSQVGRYVKERIEKADVESWTRDMQRYADLDLARSYQPNNQRTESPPPGDIQKILDRMGKHQPEDHLNCGACGYETCFDHAMAIWKGRAETEMCLPHTIEQLRSTVNQLASTQAALVNSEKMASMGQLAAGIAHEVNNPLGVVLMYAHMMLEEVDKTSETHEDLQMIVEQADRCKKIISGLLNFARKSKVDHRAVNLPELLDRALGIVNLPHNIRLETRHELEDPIVEIDADQIVQVFTNLINNALGAMEDMQDGLIEVRTSGDAEQAVIEVRDTGPGIPANHLKKIFEPFFSTKTPGKGTGLGLSVSYGIIKMHRGQIDVDSNADPAQGPTGTTFRITLPRQRPAEAPEEVSMEDMLSASPGA